MDSRKAEIAVYLGKDGMYRKAYVQKDGPDMVVYVLKIWKGKQSPKEVFRSKGKVWLDWDGVETHLPKIVEDTSPTSQQLQEALAPFLEPWKDSQDPKVAYIAKQKHSGAEMACYIKKLNLSRYEEIAPVLAREGKPLVLDFESKQLPRAAAEDILFRFLEKEKQKCIDKRNSLRMPHQQDRGDSYGPT